jgi:5-methylcytosine-specific restriction protein A
MPSRPQQFRPHGQRSRAVIERATDLRRGSARERGYDAQWDRAAAAFKIANPLCLGCASVGLSRATAAVDHVEPHKGDREKFWNADNWQPACAWHHDRVKQILERQFTRGEIGAAALRLDGAQAVALTRQLIDEGERP